MRRLRNESAAFELDNYDVIMHIGKATFLLSAYNGDVPGVLVAEDVQANREAFADLYLPFNYDEEVQTVNEVAPAGVVLRLGEAVRIGRSRGVEIINRRSETDHQRHSLYNWLPLEAAIRTDQLISRQHVQVSALGLAIAEVKDFNSLNGTVVEPRLPDHL